MTSLTIFPPAGRQADGMALVMTLAILAILTTLLVSFVSMASMDRGATKSYSQSLGAEQIALGGLDQIVSQLQAEIADPQVSTNALSTFNGVSNSLYIPLNNAAALPQRTATNLPNLATLLSYSGTNLYTVGSGATNYSSPSSTLTPSLNSRSISISRWNKPQFTTNTTGFPAPQWILMTRNGAQAFTSYNSTLADGSVTNGSYVVGRYAYTVYDTSGLLDANVAGYPSASATNASGKGLLPWADLTQLGISQGTVDALVAWRNAGTSAHYATNVYAAATNNGFTAVTNGDTCFLNRQELLKYAQTQNLGLTNALPYLTTFSRELNGPTWGPPNPPGSTQLYASQQYNDYIFNPRIPNPRVKTPFTRANGVQAVVGEPLVKYRFPLDKLALLEKFTGTGNGTLSSSDIKDIQKYFGLDLAPDANGPTFRHWVYPSASRSGNSALGILKLDEVADLNPGREPDFFELLQAGMLSGSLGVPGTGNYGRSDQFPAGGNGPANFVDPDDKETLQVLRVGANIIDQWDADSFPTTVTLSLPPTSIDVYGIEDLPYPLAAFLSLYAAKANTPPFDFYIYFELWNPHQAPTGTPPSGSYPTNFRLSPMYSSTITGDSDSFLAGFQAVVTKSAVWEYDGGTALTAQYLGDPANSAYSPLQLPVPMPANNYREPTLVPGSTLNAPAPLNTVACFTPRPLSAFPPTNTKANDDGAGTKFPATPSTYTWSVKIIMSLGMRIQYQDGGGNWRTYGTFMGIDDQGGAFTAGTGYILKGITALGTTPPISALSFIKSDPRTFRLGAGANLAGSVTNASQALATSSGIMNDPVNALAPFGSKGPGATAAKPYRLDMWAANDSGVAVKGASSGSPYYADIDGVTRWGDARNSYKLANTSPVFTGSMANRPVMLNRPFQSVGDLGYAYRDAAWKTLDFASNTSADAALLDLFTLSDAPVVAGRVNPNTPYPQVLAAMISGALQSTTNATTVSASSALAAAQTLQGVTSNTPFINRADIVASFMTNSAITALAPSGIKTEEESLVRAVAESSNTRTWNFMIDIIAQSGRYPTAAKTLDNFTVEGERRYWLHIAVDRYTGQVVDKQLEIVNE